MQTKDVIADLKALVKQHGSQQRAATALGISLVYVNDLLHGRRQPGPTVLKALGFRKSYDRV